MVALGSFLKRFGAYMEMIKSKYGAVSEMTLAVLHDIQTATAD
jgi:hypothetical protein